MTNNVGLKEFREDVEKYVRLAESGHDVLVYKRTKPLFKIESINDDSWEEVIDFTKFKSGGIKVEDLISRLKKLK